MRSVAFRDWPLRAKMAALLVVASAVPQALAGAFGYRTARTLMREQAVELLRARADEVAVQIDAFHRAHRVTTGRLASLAGIRGFLRAPRSRRAREGAQLEGGLRSALASDPSVRGLGIFDPAGTVLLATEAPLVGRNCAFRPYFGKALGGGPVVSDVYSAAPEVGSAPSIAYAAPVTDESGAVLGVVALWVRAQALWDLVRRGSGRAGEGSYSVLLDPHGIRVAHSVSEDLVFRPTMRLDPEVVQTLVAERRFGDRTSTLLENPAHLEDVTAEAGEPLRRFSPFNEQWNLGVARRLEAVPWTLLYFVPEASLEAPAKALVRRTVVGSAAIIALALVAGMLVTGLIVRPVLGVTRVAEALAQGDRAARVEVSSADEVGELARSFHPTAETLAASQAELEGKVRERTATLERVNEELRGANDELEAFSYSVSHDLRAPLRHVVGFADALGKRAGGSLDETSRRHLESISRAAKRMDQLIDDLLAFSRTGRAEMLRSRVDLGGLLREVVEELRQHEHGRNVAWRTRDLPAATGDPALLRIAFANLLSNALKYTRGRDPAEIEVGAEPGPPGQVALFVRDNGVGFDPLYAGKLFGVFQRLHPAEDFEGTGVGLATVRRIVHRHGGRVWAEGAPGAGATFHLTLPAHPEPPSPAIVAEDG